MCLPKMMIGLIIVACALMMRSDPTVQWKMALDSAKTPAALSALHNRIKTEMVGLTGENLEFAQRFLDVIERKQIEQPYAEDFKQLASGKLG